MTIDMQEDGNDFVLRREENGQITELRLSEEDVLIVAQSAPLWRDRIVLRRSPRAGDVTAVVVTPVTAIGVQPDSLKTSVLLTLQSSTRGQLTYGLSPLMVRLALEHLPQALAEIEDDHPIRQ